MTRRTIGMFLLILGALAAFGELRGIDFPTARWFFDASREVPLLNWKQGTGTPVLWFGWLSSAILLAGGASHLDWVVYDRSTESGDAKAHPAFQGDQARILLTHYPALAGWFGSARSGSCRERGTGSSLQRQVDVSRLYRKAVQRFGLWDRR